MGLLIWRHSSHYLYNSVSKILSNLLVTASDVGFCSMFSVAVLSFYDFILSIFFKIYAIFKTFMVILCALAPLLGD